jgi:subtilase family serine protease
VLSTTVRRTLIAGAAAAIGLAVAGAPVASAAGISPQRIGVAPAVPHGSVAIAAPAASQPLHLDVALAPRNSAALNGFVSAVSTPGSPEYHNYLSKGQFAAEFGPTQTTVNAVRAALSAAGLTPGATTPDGLTIPVDTTVGQAGTAFATGFAGYRLANGRTAYANTAAPQLASSASGAIVGVVGLNNFVSFNAAHSQATKPAVSAAASANAVSSNSATPGICSSLKTDLANNPNGALIDQQNYWEPGTLSAPYAYNTAQLYGQYGNTGAGVTVGIFELENYDTDDITHYQQCMGTNVPVTNVKVDGGSTGAVDYADETGLETALDIETVAGLAPGAAIKVYQGPDAATATDPQVLDTYQQMVTDDSAQVLSTSWGACEADIQDTDPGFFAQESTVFAEAAAQGQTVVASSGDTGSTACYQNTNSTHGAQLSADDPASQPDVTAVGGTSMTGGTSASSPATQTTWNNPATSTSRGAASGGGVSAVETLTGSSNYQSGVSGAGYTNACNAATGSTCRQVPDVSALGDPNTGYLITWLWDDPNYGGWYIIGGTSGAAPLWAAIAALADASTACAANGNVGLMNPALYAHTSSLWDVTSGNNDVLDSGYAGGKYAAGTGYDMATGLGTPHAPQLAESLCGSKAAGVGSTFTPAGPTRLLDTRYGTGAPQKQVGTKGVVKLQVTGVAGVPSGVTAVVLNVTATGGTLGSYITVYPDGTARPASSNLNFDAGETIPNLVTVPVGSDGAVDLFNFQGNVDLVADLFGYYTTGSGSKFVPLSPIRVLDTRNGTGAPKAKLGAKRSIPLQISGANGVPATNVTSVVLNVTATGGTLGSYLQVYPDGSGVTPGSSSNLNFNAGQTIPNLVTVPVGSDGAVDVFNFQGAVDVVADLLGYYTSDASSGYLFHPSAPHRLVDTRYGTGVAAGQTAPVGANTSLSLPLADTNGTGNAGPLATAKALMLNVTVTAPTLGGYLTVFPSGVARPLASNLNFDANETIPNAVSTAVNGSSINFYNFQGAVQLVVDLFGYFSAT